MNSSLTAAVNKPSRLEALAQYEIMDSLPEAAFDKLASVARFACDAPFAAVSFIDQDRQWFKSQLGLAMNELPVDQSFCAHALVNPGKVMIVEDASKDPRFAHNPLVCGDQQIRFYAGIPITTPEGIAVGAVCIYDSRPRQLRPEQSEGLKCLAEWAASFLEKRLPELAQQRCPTCGGPKDIPAHSLS